MLLFLSLVSAACTRPVATVRSASKRSSGSETITVSEIAAHIRYLSHDLLEGRAVGSRGIRLAALYHESHFRALGLEPLFGHSYRQRFQLVGSRPDPGARLELLAGAGVQALTRLEDFVVNSHQRACPALVEGELVYGGYLIQAPRRGWDDIKGMNLRGKVLLVEVNEPGNREGGIFEGRNLTYFGRWTYKFQKASQLGAAGILLIHDTHRATYGWEVVRNSWSKESFFLPRAGEAGTAFAGWLHARAVQRALAAAGKQHHRLLALAQKKDFSPISLGLRVRVQQRPRFRAVTAENVGAVLRGRRSHGAGPQGRARRAIIVTAHHDHLGRDRRRRGDQIYNGAKDNCSASAAMLSLARHFAQRRHRLQTDLLFLAPTAEEVGMLGSRHFVQNLPLPAHNIVANINLELANVFGPTEDVYAIGARHSELDRYCRRAAHQQGLQYIEEQGGEDGFFFRSDQLSFARAGIPAVWLHEGNRSRGADARLVVRRRLEYRRKHYHRVSDEMQPDWDLRGVAQLAHWAAGIIRLLDRARQLPRFHKSSSFRRKTAD